MNEQDYQILMQEIVYTVDELLCYREGTRQYQEAYANYQELRSKIIAEEKDDIYGL